MASPQADASTSSGIAFATRASSKKKAASKALHEDSSQRPRKRTKTEEYTFGWVLLHEKVDVGECLSVTQHEFEDQFKTLLPRFVVEINELYGLTVEESKLRIRIAKEDINLNDVDSDWMKSVLHRLGKTWTADFLDGFMEMTKAIPPFWTIRDVIEHVPPPKKLQLIVTVKKIIGPQTAVDMKLDDALVRRYTENILHAKDVTCPFKAGKSEFYVNEQEDSDLAIYDGRHGPNQKESRAAPPIEIFHPVFKDFHDYLHNPTYQPSPELVRMTHQFMEAALTISTAEEGRAEDVRFRLSEILKKAFMEVGNKTRADGSVWMTLGHEGVLLLLIELKREYGEGGCDPATQASFACRNYWLQHKGVRDKCCCPTFIIAAGGPWLGLLGGVFTDKFIVQRLTELTWTGFSSAYEDKRLYWLARTFNALGNCLDDLAKYYGMLDKATFRRSDYFNYPSHLAKQLGFKQIVKSRFFPYPRFFTQEDEHGQVQRKTFRYLLPLETCAACVTYLARICHDDDDDDDDDAEKIVVKFVAQYGKDVHEFLAKEGHAPKLRYFGPLLREDDKSPEYLHSSSCAPMQRYEWAFPGLHFDQLRMVVMDYVEACDQADIPKHERGEQIAEVLKKLHDNGFVFGDLRPPNVILDKDKKVKFIDFDWSGRYKGSDDGLIPEPGDNEKPRYPVGLSEKVKWPMDVKEIGLQYIKPEDDWIMLKRQFDYPLKNEC